MSSRLVSLAAALVLAGASPAEAQPDCGPEADRLRAHLVTAEKNTFRWNLAWSLAFGTAAAGQLTLALVEVNPFGEFDDRYRDTLYVGAAKATIGLASRVVMPLRAEVPGPSADRCAELSALRASVTRVGIKERRTFFLTHLGGMALNVAGAALLWHRHDFKTGAISFAMSYPVGLLSGYTLPRASWHVWREHRDTWSIAVGASAEHASLSLRGEW